MRIEGDFEVVEKVLEGTLLRSVNPVALVTDIIVTDKDLTGKVHLIIDIETSKTGNVAKITGKVTDEELLNTARIEIQVERGGTSGGSSLPKEDDTSVLERFEELKSVRDEEGEVKKGEENLSPSEKLKLRKRLVKEEAAKDKSKVLHPPILHPHPPSPPPNKDKVNEGDFTSSLGDKK